MLLRTTNGGVIPVWADKNYKKYCPPEMQLLPRGSRNGTISSASSPINTYLNNKFDKLINDGEKSSSRDY